MKMPMNNEVDEDASREVKQAAEAAKRALKENPTMTLNDAYRFVLQFVKIFTWLLQFQTFIIKYNSVEFN